MKKMLLIFGTRPEAIKMAPVVMSLQEDRSFRVRVAVSAQHRQMLDQVLELFGITPDWDLNLMTFDQDLYALTARVLHGLKEVLTRVEPDLVMVQGDTTTTLAGALAAFYARIPVAHVEAGLRTRDKYRPFPEELNRRLTCVLADYHFAPTDWARDNLLAEGVPAGRIWVTGNTVVDAFKFMAARVLAEEKRWQEYLAGHFGLILEDRRLLLVTGHRRENLGPGLVNVCLALRDLLEGYPDLHIVYPVHLNPQVQRAVYQVFAAPDAAGAAQGRVEMAAAGGGRLSLLPPLSYAAFVYLLTRCYLVLTDSGGIQEEAPALGKPVLVLREVTERPEALWARTVKLVGTDRGKIVRETRELLNNPNSYREMAQAKNPYGDGQAARRIVGILKEVLGGGG